MISVLTKNQYIVSELTQQTFDELRLVLPVNKNEIDGNSSQNDCNADSYRNYWYDIKFYPSEEPYNLST